ncbi:MAG: hypothetical protein GY714_12200 [Desulfobacterales bacterium]|nr:hypothetical protein [Desulfobacterales bacterium]
MNLNIDTDGLKNARLFFEVIGDKANGALARSVNRTIQGVKTDSVRSVRENYNVKAASVRKGFSFKKANRRSSNASALVRGSRISLREFGVRPNSLRSRPKVGLSVRVGRQRKTIRSSFFSKGKHIYRRVEKSRLPVEKLLGPSIPQMMNNEEVVNNVEKSAVERFEKNFKHEMGREIQRSLK